MLKDFIDKVYLINLESRHDRLSKATSVLTDSGIHEFKIINPNLDIIFENSALSKERQSVKDSHMRCIIDAIENKYENIIIFEDDIVFNQSDGDIEDNIQEHLRRCMEFIKKNEYDIFYLDNISVIQKDSNGIVTSLNRDHYTNDIDKITGKPYAHSYVLNKRVFSRLLSAQLDNPSICNDGVLIKIDAIKYIYNKGIYDQQIGVLSNNNA